MARTSDLDAGDKRDLSLSEVVLADITGWPHHQCGSTQWHAPATWTQAINVTKFK
jgi:hypothetical protein